MKISLIIFKSIVIGRFESSIRTDTKRIRSLSTPDIIRTEEPNEVIIEIFNGMLNTSKYSSEYLTLIIVLSDGKLKVAVNEIDALHAHIDYASSLKYFSFASSADRQREEFFYYCN